MSIQKQENTIVYENITKSDFYILGKILASPNKKKILYTLRFPKTLKEIAEDTKLTFPTISKAIKELEGLCLIEINNKDYRKGKIISISSKGLDIISDLRKRDI